MNKNFLIIAFSLFLCSCIGKRSSDAQKAMVTEESTIATERAIGDTLQIDIASSKLYWKGTKMRGAGKHEGEIEIKNGYFMRKNEQLVGGAFVVGMTTIEVTDIPKHETVPIKNLNKHLKSPDFFDVEKYPIAEFQITNVKPITSDSLTISGNLKIKDVTKNIKFAAKFQSKSFKTTFTFDRFKWNIAYEGNLVDKTLVDKDIEFKVALSIK